MKNAHNVNQIFMPQNVREGAIMTCWMTQNIVPSITPTEVKINSILWSYQTHHSIKGSESWLVSFDECQSLGRQGVIQSQHGNKFFSVSVSGVFHISVTYVPVIIQGKPVRVSG